MTIYNYINQGAVKVWKLKRKTLIRRADIDALFDILRVEQVTETKVPTPITEFYTSKEVQEKYGISN